MKIVYLILGFTALALGLIGAVLPVLPTTPFLILATYLFAKSSPKMRLWLLNLPWAGPLIQDWETYRSLRLGVKRTAIIMVLVTCSISFFVIGARHFLLRPILIVLTAIGIWVISRIPTRR